MKYVQSFLRVYISSILCTLNTFRKAATLWNKAFIIQVLSKIYANFCLSIIPQLYSIEKIIA